MVKGGGGKDFFNVGSIYVCQVLIVANENIYF